MIPVIKQWLIGVTAAALVVALADALAPEGAVKKIGKLAGGLLMLIAIIQPLIKFDFEIMAGILTENRIETQVNSKVLDTENQRLMKIIIEGETAAYIQDKADELGINCTAEVICGLNEFDEIYPTFVTVYGNLNDQQKMDIRRMIEGDLAVPAGNQRFERTKEQ